MINGRHPPELPPSDKFPYARSRLADDQIRIGEALTKRARLLVARQAETLPVLGLDYFGYRLAFAPEAEAGQVRRTGAQGNAAARLGL